MSTSAGSPFSTEISLAFARRSAIMKGNIEGESPLKPSKESADTAASRAAGKGQLRTPEFAEEPAGIFCETPPGAPVTGRKSTKQGGTAKKCFAPANRQGRFLLAVHQSIRQYHANELVRWRVNFSSDAIANFEDLLDVNQEICKQQMAEKMPPASPASCAGLPIEF